jgi:hypothetical protein
MIAQYLTVLLYFGLISLCIELASPRVSSLVILVGVIYPIYLLFLLSAELFASESVRVDRYAVEVERTLLGFSVGDEVFKTESIRNVRVGAIRTWSSREARIPAAESFSMKATIPSRWEPAFLTRRRQKLRSRYAIELSSSRKPVRR